MSLFDSDMIAELKSLSKGKHHEDSQDVAALAMAGQADYQCICRHGNRFTVETQGFYTKVMDDGTERKSWGWSCEHVPDGFGKSYEVFSWNKKSYQPFKI